MKKILFIYLLLMSFIASAIIKTDNITTNNPSKQFIDFLKSVDIQTTDGMYLPAGTTAQQPTPSKDGMVRYNTDLKAAEIYADGAWVPIGKGGISDWFTGEDYKTGDVVIEDDKIYQALNDHTSTIFATDLANGDWKLISAIPDLVGMVTSVGNVTTVVTNADLTGDVISTGNATTYNNIVPVAKGGTNSSTALTNDKVVISDAGKIVESSTTTTQLGYLDATSSVQTQIDSKVTGPASSTDNAIARYDSTTGKLIQNSVAILGDTGNLSGINDLTITGNTTLNTSLTGLVKSVSGVLSASSLTNADVSASAAIDYSKLASLSTGQMIFGNAGVPTAGAISGGMTIGATGVVTLGNTAVTSQLLTGYTSGAGTVSATDSILQAIQKLNGNDAGKIPLSTILFKGDLIVGTGAGAVARLQPQSNGRVVAYDISAPNFIGARDLKEDEAVSISFSGFEDVSSWSKGNNANVMGGGTLQATFERDITTNISVNGSFKLTQAAGSLNDYFCTPTRTLYKSDKGDTYFVARSTYNGATGDIQPYLWDATNSTTLSLVAIKGLGASNSSQVSSYAVNIPDATSSVQLCYQVKALNSGKIFNVSQIQLTKSLSSLGIVNNTNFTYPEKFIPVLTGGASFSDEGSYWWREGKFLVSRGTGVITTPSGTAFSVQLPNGYLVDPNVQSTTLDSNSVGILYNTSSTVSNAYPSTARGAFVAFTDTTVNNVIFFSNGTSGSRFAKTGGSGFFGSGDRYRFEFKVPILGWDVGNAQVASSNQITSSDSMTFVHKTTAIVAGDPVGTINTFIKVGTALYSDTICATVPTQTFASMNTDGIAITGRAYNVANTCATPSKYVIKVPTGLKDYQLLGYRLAGKISGNEISTDFLTYNSSEWYGAYKYYDSTLGTLTIELANVTASITGARGFLDKTGTVGVNPGYISFSASTQPNISVIPNASLCNNTECINDFSALSSAAVNTIVSSSYPGWITSTSFAGGEWTINFKAGIFPTVAPSCTVTTSSSGGDKGQRVYNETTSSIKVALYSAGATVQDAFHISCSKQYPDARPTQFKVAGINDSSSSYYITSSFAASTTVPINFGGKEFDTDNAVTTSATAWKYTAKKSGIFSIKGVVVPSAAGNMFVYKNGVQYKYLGGGDSAYSSRFWFSTDVPLLQGEYIDIRPASNITFNGGVLSALSTGNISITRTGEY